MVGTIIDEGASMSILSLTTWKALSSPSLLPEMRNLTGFDKGTSRPLGILPNVPITLRRKTVHMNVMAVQGPLDYNLLLGRDYIYCMGVVVSSLFRVMCFSHEGRMVKLVDQLSFPGSHIANSQMPSLNGIFTQGISHRSPVRPPDERPDHLLHIETWEEPINLEEGLPDAQLSVVHVVDGHFEDIIHFLMTRTNSEGYTIQQKKELVVHAADFSVITRHLYKLGSNEILRRYVPKFERSSVFMDAHVGVVGGHYAGRVTGQKILYTGLWWPTLHQDSKAYYKACNVFQRTGKPL
eukprot:PITA_04044